jgi:hypothetical protein
VILLEKKKKIILGMLALIAVSMIFVGAYSTGNEIASKANIEMISHSEYMSGETGQVIGKLYNYRGQPILADCNVTIYNPDKTIFLAPVSTDDTLESVDGTHYINFTTPTAEGVYEYMIACGFTLNGNYQTRTISNSFHLNPALNLISTLNSSVNSNNNIILQINNTVTDIKNDMFSDLDAYNNFTAVNNNFVTVNYKLDNVQNNLTQLKQFCSDTETNSSALCQLVWDNNQKIIAMQTDVDYISDVQLILINQTTQNTYDYMIGTLATNINTIISNIANVQNGINQINSTVNNIQSNVTTVINNQEDIVYFDVTS